MSNYLGTPATQSQLAKDVCTFLRWTSEIYHDDRKLYGFRVSIMQNIMRTWHKIREVEAVSESFPL